ncbi:hypothetical protein [Gulosibacter molinativorax]|uniref:Uncharacterized protein n=1 Tax=Gulosibacter molinativorax TaxID=256821 RepID=A0ABT7C9J0_9MICO|nr:hypothetical protein [Gulosibacter molinativorax]MDJ1371412.1 hypothetical protein [Gulosibacter molinativorax]QUY62910.1 Hypotetical protein [Gulosibacter molinativorax]
MKSILEDVLSAARTLSRSERAEVAHALIATLETTTDVDDTRYAELKAEVNVGLEELDRGEGIEIPAESLEEYLQGLGLIASDGAGKPAP